MAREHVQNYYVKVLENYLDMKEMLDEAKPLLEAGKVSQEQVDNLSMTFLPIELNYKQISYIMYLLNEPKRKDKQTRYEKRMANKLKRLDPNDEFSPEQRLMENYKSLIKGQEIIDKMKENTDSEGVDLDEPIEGQISIDEIIEENIEMKE